MFRPGVWTADLSTIAADRNDVATAIAGTGLPDPTRRNSPVRSSTHSTASKPTPTPDTVHRRIRLRVAPGGVGQDVETVARSAAAGIAQSSGTAFEPHTALYLGVYADAPAALEVVIIDGTSGSIDATTGLSSIWGRLAEESAALGLDVPDSERAGFQESMDAGALIVQSLTTFEFDDTSEVVAPSRWWHHRGGGTNRRHLGTHDERSTVAP